MILLFEVFLSFYLHLYTPNANEQLNRGYDYVKVNT